MPAKVSNKIKDDGKQKAWLCLRHNRASFFIVFYSIQVSHVSPTRPRHQNTIMSPHALKGQKLLAQGIALGYYGRKPVAL